jgi:hypothetical protein
MAPNTPIAPWVELRTSFLNLGYLLYALYVDILLLPSLGTSEHTIAGKFIYRIDNRLGYGI